MKLLLTLILFGCTHLAYSQTADTLGNQELVKELGDNACKCVDSIDIDVKSKNEILTEINKCISDNVMALQLGSKLMQIDLLKENAEEKDGKKQIDISIDTNTNSKEYKEYYYQMERYLMKTCSSVKDKISTNDKPGEKSISSSRDARALYSKGLTASEKQDYTGAIRYYEQAIKIDPEFAFAWDNIGLCYRKLENYDKALEAYQKSLQIDPNGMMPLQNIAIVYQYKKEFQNAIDAYEKLAQLDKNNPEIYYGIGLIYSSDLPDLEKSLSYMCKAYNLYVAQKSPFRTDAEKIIGYLYSEMKKKGEVKKFEEILTAHKIKY